MCGGVVLGVGAWWGCEDAAASPINPGAQNRRDPVTGREEEEEEEEAPLTYLSLSLSLSPCVLFSLSFLSLPYDNVNSRRAKTNDKD